MYQGFLSSVHVEDLAVILMNTEIVSIKDSLSNTVFKGYRVIWWRTFSKNKHRMCSGKFYGKKRSNKHLVELNQVLWYKGGEAIWKLHWIEAGAGF